MGVVDDARTDLKIALTFQSKNHMVLKELRKLKESFGVKEPGESSSNVKYDELTVGKLKGNLDQPKETLGRQEEVHYAEETRPGKIDPITKTRTE